MAESRIDPYVRKNPGDVIRSGDWNEAQVLVREDITQINDSFNTHTHTGEADGLRIPRNGIEPNAINETLVDPNSALKIASLEVGEDTKLNRVNINGPLSIGTSNTTHIMNLPAGEASLSLGENIFVNGEGSTGRISNNAFRKDGSWQFADPSARASTISLRDNGMIEMYGTVTPGQSDWKKLFGMDASLNVAYFPGKLIRRMYIATDLGPNDGTDQGQIKSRILNINKAYKDTAIRILYCDNFRVLGHTKAARWEIRVDGKAPPGGAIYQDKYTRNYSTHNMNQHEPATILGYAQGLSVGDHQIQIWIGPSPGYPVADFYTGWNKSRWTIEAEEVWV